MSLFGIIMMFITMGWTALLMFVMFAHGGIAEFMQSAATTTFIIGYIIIIVVYVVLKRIVLAL